MLLIPSSRTLIRMIPLLIGLGTFLPDKGWTTLYQCKDADGTTVFTDSPAQLTQCMSLDPDTLSPESDATPANPSPIPQKFNPRPSPPSAPSADQESAPATLHLTRIDNAMVVQVLINRKQYVHLLVDTGASMTVLSHNLAAELNLLSGAEVALRTLNTAGGPIQVNTTNAQEIRAGSAIARNVPIAVYDLPNLIPGISGILGMSFLNNFKVTLEPEHAMLHLDPNQ